MQQPITIALDAMGGDYGVPVVVPAAIRMLQREPHLRLILVGDQDTIKDCLAKQRHVPMDRLDIHHTTEVVAMDELPSSALRTKKDSSLRVTINLVKEGRAQAAVSAGNTGALMATARFVLKTLPGIDRPAIITRLPTLHQEHPVHVLDLGANVDSDSATLFQFAVMGSVLTSLVDNIDRPRVGLLNIGQEEIKGNDTVKQTAELLSRTPEINYIGYVEGDDIFQGVADVVVADGFVGNVALKTTEGVAKMIAHYIKISFKQNLYTKFAALLALPVLRILQKKIDPSRYNGASLIGLQGTVIKSHGGANIVGFTQAIKEAVLEVSKNVPQRIGEEVGRVLEKRQS